MTEIGVVEISKSYGKFKALERVSLEVHSEEFLVVMGPSGSGKTTLLLVILGILQPDSGEIYLGREKVTQLSVEDRNFGYVPQDYGLFPHMSVSDNVAFGLKVRGVSRTEAATRVAELLMLVDLLGLEKRMPHELSGGQRQRVAFARALAMQPPVLLLDEPLSNVDEATKAEVRVKLKETVKKAKVTTICVLHEPDDAAALGDRIAIMYGGRLIQTDTLDALFEKPSNEIVPRLLTSHLIGHRVLKMSKGGEDLIGSQQ